MSAQVFPAGRAAYADKVIGWTIDTQKSVLLDMSVSGPWVRQITGVTNANPAVYTFSGAANFSNGDILVVLGVGGNLSANQTGIAASVAANTFQLAPLESQGGTSVAGSGAFSSAGFVVNLTQATFVLDILGTRVGTDQSLTSTTNTQGTLSSATVTYALLTGANPVQGLVLYDSAGGSDATNRLTLWQDGKIRVVVNTAALAGDLALLCEPLLGAFPSGTVLWLSNGASRTTTADAALGDRSITVAANAAVAKGVFADVAVTGAGLPFTPTGVSQLFTPGAILNDPQGPGWYKL